MKINIKQIAVLPATRGKRKSMNIEKMTSKDFDSFYKSHGAEETLRLIITLGRNCFVGNVHEWIALFKKYSDLATEERMTKGTENEKEETEDDRQ